MGPVLASYLKDAAATELLNEHGRGAILAILTVLVVMRLGLQKLPAQNGEQKRLRQKEHHGKQTELPHLAKLPSSIWTELSD